MNKLSAFNQLTYSLLLYRQSECVCPCATVIDTINDTHRTSNLIVNCFQFSCPKSCLTISALLVCGCLSDLTLIVSLSVNMSSFPFEPLMKTCELWQQFLKTCKSGLFPFIFLIPDTDPNVQYSNPQR